MLRGTFIIVAFFFLVLTTLPAAARDGDGRVVRGEVGSQIAAFVTSAEKHGFAGCVLAAKDGEIVTAVCSGSADLEDAMPNSPLTLFEIASVTKQFTATAVMRLVQDGKLHLDDSIAKHLPEGSVPENCAAITIEHLLRHTSGIPGTNSEGGGDDIEAVLPSFLRGGPQHQPGTQFQYWNQGYAILTEIISRAAGMSYMEYCKQALFEPAGMNATMFTGDDAPDDLVVAIGKSSRGTPRSALEHPYGSYGFQYRGMGGVVTNAQDLWKWDRALHEDAILSKESKEQLFTPGPGGYALGWFVRSHGDPNEQKVMHQHGGGVRGFVCDMRRYPHEDAFLVVLANNDAAPLGLVTQTIEQLLFAEEHAVLDADLADALEGEYIWKERGAVLKIFNMGGILRSETHWSQRGPVTRATIEISDDGVFLNDGSDRMLVTIEREADGTVTSVTVLGSTYTRVPEDEQDAAEGKGEGETDN